MKLIFTNCLFFLFSINGFACLHTTQYKLFPVGVIPGGGTTSENLTDESNSIQTVSFDVKVKRTSVNEGSRFLNLNIETKEDSNWDEMWILETSIGLYNQVQQLEMKWPFELKYSMGSDYTDSLELVYAQGLKMIEELYPELDLFTPEYISFCDFQKKCERLTLVCDTLLGEDFLKLGKIKVPLKQFQDSTQVNLGEAGFNNSCGLYVSSVRVLKTASAKDKKPIEMVLIHLETGHEIGMGMITSDPQLANNPTTHLSEEHIPEFAYEELKQSIFQEPLLHHGYGVDLFVFK